VPILLGDCLIYGFCIAGGSPVLAALQLLTDGEDGNWSPRTLQLLFIAPEIARGFAGPIVRVSISYSKNEIVGQASYALLQTVMSFAQFVIIVLCVTPALKICHRIVSGL